jgi:hypothetical protein
MPAWSTIKKHQEDLIRKALDGSVFSAPMSAAVVAALTSGPTGALAALPSNYNDFGVISGDGVTYSVGERTSDVTSWGYVNPSRTDIIGRDVTVKFLCQETNLQTLQAYTGADLTAVATTPSSAELDIQVPGTGQQKYMRLLTISVDQAADGSGDIYIARFLPKASITAIDDQKQSADDAIAYGFTLTAHVDDAVGYAVSHMFGGPGWKNLVLKMGFPAPT